MSTDDFCDSLPTLVEPQPCDPQARSRRLPGPERTTRRAVDIVEDAQFVRDHSGYRDADNTPIAMRLEAPLAWTDTVSR